MEEKLSVKPQHYVSGNEEPMEKRSLFPPSLHICDVCLQPRGNTSKKKHTKCSEIRKKRGFPESTQHIKKEPRRG